MLNSIAFNNISLPRPDYGNWLYLPVAHAAERVASIEVELARARGAYLEAATTLSNARRAAATAR